MKIEKQVSRKNYCIRESIELSVSLICAIQTKFESAEYIRINIVKYAWLYNKKIYYCF
jgi:hypothetical protein